MLVCHGTLPAARFPTRRYRTLRRTQGNVLATQFHPEKSGAAGLALIQRFLELESLEATDAEPLLEPTTVEAAPNPTIAAPRVRAERRRGCA